MGHIRLGDLYKSKRWGQVVGLLEIGAGAEDVASASLTAAERGFRRASDDLGMRYTVWLLTQVALASRKDNFSGELNRLGIKVSKTPGLFEVVGAFTKNIDDYLTKHKARSDVSEMAQFAAVETLSEKSMQRSRSLFGTTPEDVHQAIREISKKKNFASFAKDFFSRFTCKYLSYYISREASKHVGPNKGFADIDQHTAFNEALKVHCKQSAVIVEDFAGGWFSKTAYETGITQEDATGFTFVALKKVASEIKRGAI